MFKLRIPLTIFLIASTTIVSLLHGYEKGHGLKLRLDVLKEALLSPAASVSFANPAPGSRAAPPSCRITDFVNDPLVKEYGQNNIRLSRTYEGSGTRVRRVLEKASRGESIKIAAVGGSVSAGHSVGWPWTTETHMYRRIQKWFKDTFPGVKFDLNLDSTIPAVSAWYFSFCVMATLPEDVDLIFLELDINQWAPEGAGVLENTERLYRSLLALPNQPAVIYLSVFGLVFADMTHGWRSSALISQWLDVPEINIRNWYLPHIMQKPDDIPFLFRDSGRGAQLDTRHINGVGHRAMADMVIAYLREQLCLVERGGPLEVEPSEPHWPGNEITLQLPRLGMMSKWSEKASIPILHPRCETVSSKTSPLRPVSMQGWELVDRNDKKSYEATEVGAEITFSALVTEGQLGMFVWKTPKEGFGKIICWVDGDEREERKKTVNSFTSRSAATFEHTGNMFTDLAAGNHTLTCRLKPGDDGGMTFRISAIVAR